MLMFFIHSPSTGIYTYCHTLSLHDALPCDREHLANDRFALPRALDRQPVVPCFVDAVEIGEQPDVVRRQPVQNHGNIVRRARGVKQRNIRGHPRMIDGERLAISVQQRRRCPRPAFQFDQALAEENGRSEEHTSELQSLMRISYAVICLNKKTDTTEILQQYK